MGIERKSFISEIHEAILFLVKLRVMRMLWEWRHSSKLL